MAKAFKCDRCREFYAPYWPKMLSPTSGAVCVNVEIVASTVGRQARDYCKDCLREAVKDAYA